MTRISLKEPTPVMYHCTVNTMLPAVNNNEWMDEDSAEEIYLQHKTNEKPSP